MNPPPRKSSTDIPLNLVTGQCVMVQELTSYALCSCMSNFISVVVLSVLVIMLRCCLLFLPFRVSFTAFRFSLDILLFSPLLDGLLQLATCGEFACSLGGFFPHLAEVCLNYVRGKSGKREQADTKMRERMLNAHVILNGRLSKRSVRTNS